MIEIIKYAVTYGNLTEVLPKSRIINRTSEGTVWDQVVEMIGRSDHGGTITLSQAEEPVAGIDVLKRLKTRLELELWEVKA